MGKISNLIFAIIFILFAGLQYNDPDPVLWISIYLYAVIICFMAYRNNFYPKLCLLGIGLYTVYAAILFFDKKICGHTHFKRKLIIYSYFKLFSRLADFTYVHYILNLSSILLII